MKNNSFVESSEVKIKEQVYPCGKTDGLEVVVTDKRLYVDITRGGDEESHIAQIKDVNDVSLTIKKIQKTKVVALVFAIILIVASVVGFILSPSYDFLMPVSIGVAVVGGILAIVWLVSLVPKYSIVMDIIVSGYPITVNIGISNVDLARALQKTILAQSQKANEPPAPQPQEDTRPEVNAL